MAIERDEHPRIRIGTGYVLKADAPWPTARDRPSRAGQLARARAVSRRFAFSIALTSSCFDIVERPRIWSRFATSRRCAFDAFASTPSWGVLALRRAAEPRLLARLSDGPRRRFSSQRSPTFS